MKKFSTIFGIVKVPVDFLMTVAAFWAAYQLRLITEPIEGLAKPIDYSVLPTEIEYLAFSVGAAIVLVFVFALQKMYQLKSTSSFSHEVKLSISGCLIWVMAIITYFFFTRTLPFSRLAILYSWTLTLMFIIFGRWLIKIIQKKFFQAGIGQTSLVFIGNNNVSNELYQKLSENPSYKILGFIGDNKKESRLKHLGKHSQFEYLINKLKADQIIQTEEANDQEILEYCEANHIRYSFVPDLLEVHRTNIEIQTIAGIPIINLKPTPLDGWGRVVKRLFDIFAAIFGIIILSPLLIITAIAIKLDSQGPILFTKLDDGSDVKRVGQKGELFKFYKFRSMKPNSHNMRYKELAGHNTRETGPLVKIKNDPRVTRVGKIIRKYSIDELPQLWNVLIGNMSLIGPRPHLPEEVARYEKHHKFVLTIKPGLSGLAQISGRSDLSFEEEVKLDSYYIENWSLSMDLKIILKTLAVVLRGHKE